MVSDPCLCTDNNNLDPLEKAEIALAITGLLAGLLFKNQAIYTPEVESPLFILR